MKAIGKHVIQLYAMEPAAHEIRRIYANDEDRALAETIIELDVEYEIGRIVFFRKLRKQYGEWFFAAFLAVVVIALIIFGGL